MVCADHYSCSFECAHVVYLVRVKPVDELNRSFALSHIWSFPTICTGAHYLYITDIILYLIFANIDQPCVIT